MFKISCMQVVWILKQFFFRNKYLLYDVPIFLKSFLKVVWISSVKKNKNRLLHSSCSPLLHIFWPMMSEQNMLACTTSNGLSACWSSYWPTCYLVFLRHQTSSWILRSCLAPRLEEVSNRSDWGDSETSYSHYLSSDNVYAILGAVEVCWASVSFR